MTLFKIHKKIPPFLNVEQSNFLQSVRKTYLKCWEGNGVVFRNSKYAASFSLRSGTRVQNFIKLKIKL